MQASFNSWTKIQTYFDRYGISVSQMTTYMFIHDLSLGL